ncbi:hypothetical protein DACRYDRAFT_22301 [Dacryopinax primogenitus]|uniref:Uncharacterized protein n=1 Tax=Dacryopinax primogenitus (strain DJM 731) TaxID=1858805 RepID=M5G7J7_DACPD|nr:uncharacterized protein DACRYDRAFT_22301 [Dacryopinax primogenitus]EJU01852.1 hypothetical protein DACRYDRAFT_22301 [Dacryopinax primogenitus]
MRNSHETSLAWTIRLIHQLHPTTVQRVPDHCMHAMQEHTRPHERVHPASAPVPWTIRCQLTTEDTIQHRPNSHRAT